MLRDTHFVDSVKNLIRQFMKFGAIGVLNTVLFYALYLIFLTAIQPTNGYYLAYVLSMMFAVFMNLKFTFQERATTQKVAMLVCVYFLSMYIGGLILTMFIGFSISPKLAGLLTICVTIVTNFLGMKAVAKWA